MLRFDVRGCPIKILTCPGCSAKYYVSISVVNINYKGDRYIESIKVAVWKHVHTNVLEISYGDKD